MRKSSFQLKAFTLAEVLITLAIIGVVAALTIPNIVQSYKKKAVETKLLKFYTTMQEVVKLSEIENGNKMSWIVQDSSHTIEDFYNTYLAKYLKVTEVKKNEDSSLSLYFADGSGMTLSQAPSHETNSIYVGFFPNAKNIGQTDIVRGRDIFQFYFAPSVNHMAGYCEYPFLNAYGKGFEPYSYWVNRHWDTAKDCAQIDVPTDQQEFRNLLMNQSTYGCAKGGSYCAMLIQYNNWKIPDDYPIKF